MLVTNSPRRLHNPSTPQSSSIAFHPSSTSSSSLPQQLQQSQSSTNSTQTSLPSPPFHPSSRAFFQTVPAATGSPSSPDFSGKQLQNYFETAPTSSSEGAQGVPSFFIDTSSLPISSIDQYMANSFDFQHSAANGYPFQGLPDGADLWSAIGGDNLNAPGVANQMQTLSRGQQHQQASSHRRMPSSASTQTDASQFSSNRSDVSRPRVTELPGRKPENLSHGQRTRQSSTGAHLPTPTQTPTQDSFLSPSSQTYNAMQSPSRRNNASAAAMSTSGPEDMPALTNGRHSFSSVDQRQPATPTATMGGMNATGMQGRRNGEISIPQKPFEIEAWLDGYLHSTDDSDSMPRSLVPKFERTVTDAYNDELYLPTTLPQAQAAANYLATQANPVMNDRLQAANMARSNSSNSSQSRLSPFRPESPWVHNSQLRPNVQKIERPDSQDLSYQTSPQTASEPKTISPKEAMLDYKPEENEIPLFAPSSFASQSSIIVPASAPQPQYSNMNYGSLPASTAPSWQATLQALGNPSYQAYQNYVPSVTNGLPLGVTMGTSYTMPQVAPIERTPDFPAHLTRMESSASEAMPSSSLASMTHESPKPTDSAAHTGTYSCTYHGCVERFTTPQKLQKHKRDAHRKSSNVTPGVGSGMSPSELAERNSQSGPHKCERLNPNTNKPCNAIFSRPYDLTRHEDTIHNIKKIKVRCFMCTEEKTFSRSDALTRHMRVVHPEVDFPGKHRRRGGASSP
jgi:hypothetical protein